MKRKTLSEQIINHTSVLFGCATAICLLPAQTFAKDSSAKDAAPAEPEPLTNWVDFTMGGAFVHGNDAAFQSRMRQSDDLYGGIKSMHWEQKVNDLTILLEGHALFGSEDYDVTARVDKKDVGYVKAGFKQFRTWYEGTGGFVPGVTNGWIPIYGNDELSVDRGEVFFEAGLRMENLPEITFGYTHDWRNGVKDSTSWGQTTQATATGILPTLNFIDERRDTYRLDITHTLGNTDLGLGLRYESVRNDDTSLVRTKYVATSPSTSQPATSLTGSQSNVYDSDMFNAHIFSETRLNERMLMSFGYAYTAMNTDTSGSNRTVVDGTGAASTGDHAFSAMTGGTQLSMNVANANFWWNPIDDLVIVPSFRAEWENSSGNSNIGSAGAAYDNRSSFDKLTEQLEIRYTGLDNLVLYAKAELSQSDSQLTLVNIDDNLKYTTSDISQETLAAGANWYPMRGLSVAAQYYHKNFRQDYNDTFNPDVSVNSFDAQFLNHDFDIDDVNLRVTWRALPCLTLVSRYDYQQTNMQNRALNAAMLPLNSVESADITSHIFSQSVTWMPLDQAYVQGTISYVLAETNTPGETYAPTRLTDSDNDYVTANVIIGYALDKNTDLQAGYTYYRANNLEVPYLTPGVAGSVPFGTSTEEHVFSLTMNRRISQNMIWNLGYGYCRSNDGTFGGNNDFSAHMVSTGLQIRF